MAPVSDTILNSGDGQVFWNKNDVKRYQVTVLYGPANQLNLRFMREDCLGCKGLPPIKQFRLSSCSKLRRRVSVVELASGPALRGDGVGVDELDRYRGKDPVEERCLAGPVRSGNDIQNWIRHGRSGGI